MATTTRIVIQQAVNLDTNNITASKYPRFVVNLGFSITGVTINDLINTIQETANNAAAAATSATAAKASQDAAKVSENNALASETAAKVSETNAKTSEINAKNSENAAKTSETNAKNSENAAKTSETNAKISETNAQTAQTAAELAETNAKVSQDAAKVSENNALASQNAAELAETAAKTSETNAKTSEINAKNSETAAKTSETNAKTSEINAKNSETAAELAEINAETAEINAAESARLAKISETNATNSASAAAISATNAFDSATQSATSATSSKNSAADAAASATAAANSATKAAASEDEAADHVVDAAAEADRAKAEADRAQSVVDAALDAEDIAGFYKSYKTKAEADADVANRVIDEVVQVWNQTAAQYGWYKVISINGVKSLQLVETENKLISVNNIKADTNGNVQVTIPGGNPSLWLGEVTLFPYDNGASIGYSGILLADGRLLNRADYPDLWASISAGLIPSVSETEWQAGQNQFYSTGDGTTTFRIPNLLQGQAFRAAGNGEDDTSEIQPQIPYITAVNGQAPDDTGAVVITPGQAGFGTMAGQNSDAVDITGGTAVFDTGADSDAITITDKNTPGFATKYVINTSNNKFSINASSLMGANVFSYDFPTSTVTINKLKLSTALEIAQGGTGVNAQADIWPAIRPIGPTPLAGDAVGDYDAVTLRQARNMGGIVGPTQTGVMNYGVGSFRLHDSRAWFNSYEVPSDGQLLSRAAYPDLWAYAQLVGTIEDSIWVSTPSQRGKYSAGDGSTTFRVPDRNGIKKNGDESGAIVGDSIPGLYGRGDGGVSNDDGLIQQNAAPNITGTLASGGAGAFNLNNNLGAFRPGPSYASGGIQSNGVANLTSATATFDASRSNAAYGRDSTTEVRTNSFIGVWVIRCNGGFTAANTSWSVTNGDTTAPTNGVVVYGGEIISKYQVAGADYVSSTLRSKVTIGGAVATELLVRDSRTGTVANYTMELGEVDKAFIRGLNIKVNPTSLTVGVGAAFIQGLPKPLVVSSEITKTITLFTASTWFHVYLFNNAGVADIEISSTAPTPYSYPAHQKTGDPTRRYLGSYRVSGGNLVCCGAAVDGEFYYINSPAVRILSGASNTTLTAVDYSSLIYSTATLMFFSGYNTVPNGSTGTVLLYSSASDTNVYNSVQPGNKQSIRVTPNAYPNTYFYYASPPAGGGLFYLDVQGYKYAR